MYESALTKRAGALHSRPMTTQMIPLQRSVPAARRGHQYPWSGRRANSLRLYDHGIEARQPCELPLLETGTQPTGILIVDDDRTTGPLVYLLHSLGYWSTRAASCGQSALDLAQDFFPSIVLLTLKLPDMSAYRVAARLRDLAKGRRLRLIALTDESVHTGRELAREAGFERYMAKPVGALALQQLLR
jgi:CheY-like chemotaxis protein